MLLKDVDLGEPTSFLDHVYLGCTQRECQIRKDIVDNYRSMFESRISAEAMENYPKQRHKKTWRPKRYLHGPMTWKVMQKNARKDIANRRIKRRNNFSKSRLHAWMTTKLKKEEVGSVGELSVVCFQIVLKCRFLARIGGLDIFLGLWTNLLVRQRNGQNHATNA